MKRLLSIAYLLCTVTIVCACGTNLSLCEGVLKLVFETVMMKKTIGRDGKGERPCREF
jgi:lipoprotein